MLRASRRAARIAAALFSCAARLARVARITPVIIVGQISSSRGVNVRLRAAGGARQ